MLDLNEWLLVVEQSIIEDPSTHQWVRQQKEYAHYKQITEEVIASFSKRTSYRKEYHKKICNDPIRYQKYLESKRAHYVQNKELYKKRSREYMRNLKVNHPERYKELMRNNNKKAKIRFQTDEVYRQKINQKMLEKAIKRARGEQLLKDLKQERQKQMSPEDLLRMVGYKPGIDTSNYIIKETKQ